MARILIADDEPQVRDLFRTVLERAGHDIIEAEDGDGALAAYHSQRPDLVLIDIIMPNREGVETIAELRRISAGVPILAISGGGMTGCGVFLDFARRMGANRTLTKPVRNADLLRVVAECLALERPREPAPAGGGPEGLPTP